MKSYELTDHLGNVHVVLSDLKKGDNGILKPQTLAAYEYYPFGMILQKIESSTGYRYGFNGKELDPEGMGGGGSTYDYGFRIYNPAIARFLSVDPLFSSYPWNSTFAFSENNPIRFIDLDGLEKANPEMFDLAIVMINQFRDEIIKDPSLNKTKIKNVDMTTVLDDLEKQLNAAKSNAESNVNTNNLGYYCGKSAAHNDIILYNPLGYTSLITELFTNGKSRFGGDGAKLTVPADLRDGGLTTGLSPVEEVYGKTLNMSTTNKSLVRKIINTVSDQLSKNPGNSIPHEYKRILRATGMKTLISKYEFTPKAKSGKFDITDIQTMQKAIGQGYIPIVFEDHVISSGSTNADYEKFGIHFLSIHDIKISGTNVEVTWWEYGSTTGHTKTMSIDQFTESMKGYWIPKNEKNPAKKL